MRQLRSRLTYANVTATLALFIALGGASYAAVTLPRNSVGTAQIRPRAVVLSKIAPRTRRALRGRRGRTGPRGATGAAGAKGLPGAPGLTAAAVGPGDGSPSATPNSIVTSPPATLTTTAPGRIFVVATATVTVSCSAAGVCTDSWGVYLDGAPVPSSRDQVSAAPSATRMEKLVVFGVSGTVPAGQHQIVLRDDADPDVGSAGFSAPQVGAIALGP